jgi:hypothetical protein
MKRTFTLLVSLFVCLFVSKAQAQFESGTGTESDPYIIKTAAQFNEIRNNLGSSSMSSADTRYFKLANDIDLGAYIDANWPTEGWLPFGLNAETNGYTAAYYVNLNGDDHYITGLWSNRPDNDHIALFARLSTGCKVQYLRIILSETKGGIVGRDNVGAVNGYNSNNVTFTQVSAQGKVKGRNHVGGLSGMLRSRASEKVYNCYFEGLVEGVDTVGGLGGYVSSSRTGYIENSYFSGTITASGSNKGGLIGLNESTGDITVISSYFTADYNAGFKTIGNLDQSPEAAKSLADMHKQATFVDWDFTSIWAIDEGLTTPYYRDASAQDPDFASGTGTEADPWIITTPQQFNNIRKYPGASGAPYYYKLANDLDFTNYINEQSPVNGWLPLGLSGTGSASSIYAVFDGDNHIIKGMWINWPEFNKVGLFSQVSTGSVLKNFGLYITEQGITGNNNVGAILGYSNSGSVSLQNIFVSGSVKGNDYVGGLAGCIRSSSSYAHSNCYFIGKVEGANYVGGLGAYVGTTATNNVYISNSYFAGTIIVPEGKKAGGIISTSAPDGTASITDCYFYAKDATLDAHGTDATIATGASKTLVEMKQASTFAGWDFTNIWKINEGTSTPYFKWQTEPITLGIKAPIAISSLIANSYDGRLRLKGFAPNTQVDIYTAAGVKVYSATASGSELNVSLPAHGVYIVSAGTQKIKVLF